MKKVIALQACKNSYKTIPIFLEQAEKLNIFDKYYICTDEKNPYGINKKCIIHKVEDMGYSSNMINLMDVIEEDLVFVILEDFILIDTVSKKLVQECFDFMLNRDNSGFLRMRVASEKYRNKLFKGNYSENLCYPVIKNHKHYICLQPGIWRKSFLKYCFKEGENAWECELNGTIRGREHPSLLSYCTTRTVLYSDNFLVKGHPTKAYINYLVSNKISFDQLGDDPKVFDSKKKTHTPLHLYLKQNGIKI